MKKRFLSAVGLFICMSVVVLLFPFIAGAETDRAAGVAPAASDFKSWGGMIRPGVLTGPGDYGDRQTEFDIDLFLPIWGDSKGLVFFNPHWRINDENSYELNFGLGYRRLVNNDSFIFGVNTYFDTMKTTYSNRFDQVGFGVELLSKWLDFRSNVYIPFGDTMGEIRRWSDNNFDYFLMEEAVEGADAEIGFMVPYLSDFVETRAYLGGFWYDSELVDTLDGWKFRAEMRPVKMLSIEYEYRKDGTRGHDSFVKAYLDIPFSFEDLSKGRNPFGEMKDSLRFGGGPRELRERMKERVVRDRHITIVTGVVKKANNVQSFCEPGATQERTCQTGTGIETRICNEQGTGYGAWDTSQCEITTTECTGTEQRACNTGIDGICASGTQMCSDGTWGACIQNEQAGAADCNSSLDNNCDGTPDNQEEQCLISTQCLDQHGTDCIRDPGNSNKGFACQGSNVISVSCNSISVQGHADRCATSEEVSTGICIQ